MTADTHALSLAQVLRVGVLDFLSLRDTVVLLTASCASLRGDRELLQTALLDSSSQAALHGRHLLQSCCNDWFNLVPQRIVGDEELTSICCDTTHYEADDPGKYMKIKDPMRDNTTNKKTASRYPASYYAQLLSLVGAFDRFILPACRDRALYLSSYGDRTANIPVAISLWDFHQPASRKDGGNVWTRDSVRVALNTIHEGLGDRFTDEDCESAHVSQFGAHWDSIRVTQGVDGNSEQTFCELCEMRTSVVKDFEKQVEKRQEERDAASQLLRNHWSSDGDSDGEDSAILGMLGYLQDLVPSDADDDDEMLFSDNAYLHGDMENTLEHVINSQKVHFPPFPVGKELSPEDLFGCLQDVYGYPVQCRRVSQPLKRFLVKHCIVTNRIKYDFIPREEFATSHAFRCSKIELVGGVLPSGFFCGAFVVILETL